MNQAPLPTSVLTAAPIPAPIPGNLVPAPVPINAAPAPNNAAPLPTASLPNEAAISGPNNGAPPVIKPRQPILKKFQSKKKLKVFHWKPLPVKKVEGSIFEHITINEEDIHFDLTALENFAALKKKKKQNGKKRKVSEEAIENSSTKKRYENKLQLDDMTERTYHQIQFLETIPLTLFKYNGMKMEDVIHDISNIQNIQNADYLEKLTKILPNDQEIANFRNHPKIKALKDCTDVKKAVSKLPYWAQLWYHCMEIPNALIRCRVQSMIVEINEFILFHNDNKNTLQKVHATFENNAQFAKILQLVLSIGNFLNGQSVKGCTLEIFGMMKFSRSNQDNRYSLLLYLVDMVNTNYPKLSNWVDALSMFEKCKNMKLDIIGGDVQNMITKANNAQQLVDDLKDNEEIADKVAVMSKSATDAFNALNVLDTEFGQAATKCHNLLHHYGATNINQLSGNTDFRDFSRKMLEIKSDWENAQRLIARSKNIFIALICGYIREYDRERASAYETPTNVIWTIYVFYPRWNLMAISTYLDFSKYQLNQYNITNRLPVRLQNEELDLPQLQTPLKEKEEEKQMNPVNGPGFPGVAAGPAPIPIAPPIRQRKVANNLKHIQWTRLRNVTNTIFQNIQSTENVRLDFELLRALWSKNKTKKKNKKRKFNAAQRKKEIISLEDTTRESNVRIIAQKVFKRNPKGLRDSLLTIHSSKDMDLLFSKQLMLIIPTGEEMDEFKKKAVIKMGTLDNYNEKNIAKFSLVEQLWFYCMDISFISEKCNVQLLQLEVDEFVDSESKNLNILLNLINKLMNDEQIRKVWELVWFLAIYLNKKYNDTKYVGFDIQIVTKMVTYKDVNSDYSLLSYLVENINQYYPDLGNWVNVLDGLDILNSIDLYELENQKNVLRLRLSRMDELISEIDGKGKAKMNVVLSAITSKMNKFEAFWEELMAKCVAFERYFPGDERKTKWQLNGWQVQCVGKNLAEIRYQWKKLQHPMNRVRYFVTAYCRKYVKTTSYSFDEIPTEITGTIFMYFSKSLEDDEIKKYSWMPLQLHRLHKMP